MGSGGFGFNASVGADGEGTLERMDSGTLLCPVSMPVTLEAAGFEAMDATIVIGILLDADPFTMVLPADTGYVGVGHLPLCNLHLRCITAP